MPGQDLATAVANFTAIVESPPRLKNEYVTADAVAVFKRKILNAAKGTLFPVSEVDPVGWNDPCPMYEIRWQHIDVQEIQSGGKIVDSHIVVRMYHTEPTATPNHFVGHHIHEKDLGDPDSNVVKRLQDQEIAVAKGHYDRGLPSLWGILDLT